MLGFLSLDLVNSACFMYVLLLVTLPLCLLVYSFMVDSTCPPVCVSCLSPFRFLFGKHCMPFVT